MLYAFRLTRGVLFAGFPVVSLQLSSVFFSPFNSAVSDSAGLHCTGNCFSLRSSCKCFASYVCVVLFCFFFPYDIALIFLALQQVLRLFLCRQCIKFWEILQQETVPVPHFFFSCLPEEKEEGEEEEEEEEGAIFGT